MTDKRIDVFIEKRLDFSLQIREKRGLNVALYEELVELLKQITPFLDGKDSVPKKLAEIFLDMWGAMTSSADVYGSEERSEIYMAADRLTYYARNICTN